MLTQFKAKLERRQTQAESNSIKSIASLITILLFVLLFIPSESVLSTQTQSILYQDLNAYWRFERGKGDKIIDSINENAGTIYGASWTEGKFAGGLIFDGEDDYVQMEDSESLDIVEKLTITAWVKLDKIDTGRQILLQKKALDMSDKFTNYSFYLQWTQDLLAFQLGNGKRRVGFLSNRGIKTADKWHHVAVTFSERDGQVKFYIDGEPAGTDSVTLKPIANEGPLIIGKYLSKDISRFPLHGIIDELRIYNRALTQTEIKELYQTPLPENLPPLADFEFNPLHPTTEAKVRFADRSKDPDGQIKSWRWDFGDGTTSAEKNPHHQYKDSGTYKVQLTVTDTKGASTSIYKEIEVVEFETAKPPQASFTIVPEKPRVYQQITFDASDSKDPDGTIQTYQWDLDGDGKVDQEGKTAQYSFSYPGQFQVTLTVTDEQGISSKVTRIIEVSSKLGLAETPWPMFRHDLKHTGRSQLKGPDRPIEKWVYDTGADRILFPPAIGKDGTVYIGANGSLYAISPKGKLKWKRNFGIDRCLPTPAIGANGTLYVGAGFKLYALTSNGETIWEFKIKDGWIEGVGPIRSAPAIDTNGTIYAGAGSILHAINPDGTLKWKFTTDGPIQSSPAIDDDGNIYIGSNDGNLYAINPDGSERWKFSTDSPVIASPAISKDNIIYIGSGITLHAIATNGQEKWSFLIGDLITYLGTPSPAIAQDETLYIGSYGGTLHAIGSNGRKKWEFTTRGRVLYPPTVDMNGTIYFTSQELELFAVNPDGTKKWVFDLGNSIVSSPVISLNNTIYVAKSTGKLFAIGNISDEEK